MRLLQKGDQGPKQRDHRRIRLASVLILWPLRKANHRVPEETQASSAQEDRIAAPSDSSPNNGPRLGSSFSSLLSHGRKHPTRSSSPNFKSRPFWFGKFFRILSAWQVGQPNHPPHMAGTASLDRGV